MGKYTPGSCAVKGCNQPNFEVGCVAFGKFGKQRTVFDVMNFWPSSKSAATCSHAGLLGKAPLPEELRGALGITGDDEDEDRAASAADDDDDGEADGETMPASEGPRNERFPHRGRDSRMAVTSGLNLTENRRFEFAVAAAAGAVD